VTAPSLADRRRHALERLHGGPDRAPARRPLRRGREPARDREPKTKVWDQQRGPAPAAYYVIAIVVALFVMLGLVMVLSASAATEADRGNSPYRLFNRQSAWAAFGLVGLVAALRVNLAWLRRAAIPLLGLAGAMMLLPFTSSLGVTINDARAWIAVGEYSLQPSEFLKLAVVVFAADLLARRQDVLASVGRSMPIALLALLAAAACLAQSDLGSAVVMGAIVLAVAYIAGVPLSPMFASAVLAGCGTLLFVLSDERRQQRFTAFLDITGHRDELSYQTYQGFLSIADGGLTGSGVGAGNGKLGYLPLAHSDFIFAVVADELGLVGTIAVVGGFMLLVWFGIQAALAAPDRFGMLLAGGIAAWFGVQAVINLGGVTGLMPVTGLTLPFFSAGGSSLFVSMTAAGLLLNVAGRARS
jgi:cell division protein FtsW